MRSWSDTQFFFRVKLRTIRDRLYNSQQSAQLLELYRQILERREVDSTNSPEEKELLLSGLAIEQQGTFKK